MYRLLTRDNIERDLVLMTFMSNVHNMVNDLECMSSLLKAKAAMIQVATCRVGSQGYLPSYRFLFLTSFG